MKSTQFVSWARTYVLPVDFCGELAEKLPTWFPLAMDLALITGQRREDVSCLRFSNIIDDRLYVKQIKTGMKIALPLSLSLPPSACALEQWLIAADL